MDKELLDYLLKNYQHLMTIGEATAFRNFLLDEKLQVYNTASDEYTKHLNKLRVKNDIVLDLMKGGFADFQVAFANRILNEHNEKVFINKCQKCGRLARTPFAKQCPNCYFQWH